MSSPPVEDSPDRSFCSPSIYMSKVLCLVLVGLMGRAEDLELAGRNATAGRLVLEVT